MILKILNIFTRCFMKPDNVSENKKSTTTKEKKTERQLGY